MAIPCGEPKFGSGEKSRAGRMRSFSVAGQRDSSLPLQGQFHISQMSHKLACDVGRRFRTLRHFIIVGIENAPPTRLALQSQ